MSKGDFVILTLPQPSVGALIRPVKAGTTASINAGEFVTRALTTGYVAAIGNVSTIPSVGTTYLAGLAMTASNETTTADGTVAVLPLQAGTVYLGTPAAPTSWDTQAEYNAMVGKRVKIQGSAGAYTVLATDGSSNALIVMPLDIKQTPGKVAFSLRAAVSDLQ